MASFKISFKPKLVAHPDNIIDITPKPRTSTRFSHVPGISAYMMELPFHDLEPQSAAGIRIADEVKNDSGSDVFSRGSSNRRLISLDHDSTDHALLETAHKHYSLDMDSTGAHEMFAGPYRSGDLAKSFIAKLTPKKPYEEDSVFSEDYDYSVTTVSGFIAHAKPFCISLVWDVELGLKHFIPHVSTFIHRHPFVQLAHSVEISHLNNDTIAALCDFIVFTKDGIMPEFAKIVEDDGEIFISILSTDPRILSCLALFKHKARTMPLRFFVGERATTYFHSRYLDSVDLIKTFKLKIIFTHGYINEVLPNNAVVEGTLESSNPLFNPSPLFSVGRKKTPPASKP
jgi:hypothetical protein